MNPRFDNCPTCRYEDTGMVVFDPDDYPCAQHTGGYEDYIESHNRYVREHTDGIGYGVGPAKGDR